MPASACKMKLDQWMPSVASCHVFLFNDTATTEIYTLSLHDALPISGVTSTVPPSDTASDAEVMTGASLTLVNETLPAKTLLRLLTALPSLAWIEKVEIGRAHA